jgi:hypothetical protein
MPFAKGHFKVVFLKLSLNLSTLQAGSGEKQACSAAAAAAAAVLCRERLSCVRAAEVRLVLLLLPYSQATPCQPVSGARQHH